MTQPKKLLQENVHSATTILVLRFSWPLSQMTLLHWTTSCAVVCMLCTFGFTHSCTLTVGLVDVGVLRCDPPTRQLLWVAHSERWQVRSSWQGCESWHASITFCSYKEFKCCGREENSWKWSLNISWCTLCDSLLNIASTLFYWVSVATFEMLWRLSIKFVASSYLTTTRLYTTLDSALYLCYCQNCSYITLVLMFTC